jgi:hypothetical protein
VKISQIVFKERFEWLIRKAPPDIVMIGEGIGTIICSIKPPRSIAKGPLVLMRARIKSRIEDMGNSIEEIGGEMKKK